MNLTKFMLLSFLGIVVGIPLVLIDWAMIIHLTSHVMQLGGIELIAVSGLFIFAMTVLPIVGVSPAVTERINQNRYSCWTNQAIKKEGSLFVGLAIVIFLVFSLVFLIMSVTNSDRFIVGQNDQFLAMFSGLVGDMIANATYGSSNNAVLASWITGFLPFFTTLISFSVYVLLCLDKKEERLRRDIEKCNKEKAKINSDIADIEKGIESDGNEKVLIDNLNDYVSEIQHNINEFLANKGVVLKRSKDEQEQEFEEAHAAIEKQSLIYLNNFYEHGKQRFEAIKANKEVYKAVMAKWTAFYEEMRAKIITELSRTNDTKTSYAALVATASLQKPTRRA